MFISQTLYHEEEKGNNNVYCESHIVQLHLEKSTHDSTGECFFALH